MTAQAGPPRTKAELIAIIHGMDYSVIGTPYTTTVRDVLNHGRPEYLTLFRGAFAAINAMSAEEGMDSTADWTLTQQRERANALAAIVQDVARRTR